MTAQFATACRLGWIAILAASSPLQAGPAVFSADGKRIYLAGDREGTIEVLDLEANARWRAPAAGLEGTPILGMVRTNSGQMVLHTPSGLRRWEPKGKADDPGDSGSGIPNPDAEAPMTSPRSWQDRVFVPPLANRTLAVEMSFEGRTQTFWLGTDQAALAAERSATIYKDLLRDGWKGQDPPIDWRDMQGCYNPATGQLACFAHDPDGGSSRLWIWDADRQQLVPVRKQRVGRVQGAAFDQDGALFFGMNGDLWHGVIKQEGGLEYELEAYRAVPLATLEAGLGTPSQVGVESVVVAGDRLYVHLYRLGGSGWGEVIRLGKPGNRWKAEPASDDPLALNLDTRLGLYREALASVQRLGGTSLPPALAVSADGRQVFFQAEDAHGQVRDWIVREGGDPEILPLRGR